MMMFVNVFGRYFPCGRNTCARLHHKECLDGTCTTTNEGLVAQLISHHLRIARHTGDELGFIGQNRPVHILHHAADGIDKRRVVRIFIVDTHLLFTHNLQRLTDRILVAEETSGKSFGNDALVGSIESRRSVARYQREIEELEKVESASMMMPVSPSASFTSLPLYLIRPI